MSLYCPKCNKKLDKARLAEVNERLKKMYRNDSLDRGLCPVCGTPLLDLDKGERK